MDKMGRTHLIYSSDMMSFSIYYYGNYVYHIQTPKLPRSLLIAIHIISALQPDVGVPAVGALARFQVISSFHIPIAPLELKPLYIIGPYALKVYFYFKP